MKKILIIALTVVLTLAFASIAFAGVTGSEHDLSSGTTNAMGTTSQVCVFCHHPHRGAAQGMGSTTLLWNINSIAAGTTFATYVASDTIQASGNAVDVDVATGPQSYLCMACHDGAVAANAIVAGADNGSATSTGFTLTGSANLGTTLIDDHPVNFTYDSWLVSTDGGLASVATISAQYPLYSNLMQCATCHDVHAGGNTSASTGLDFMRGNTAGSEICIDCHTNK